jgi:hypothetical protein
MRMQDYLLWRSNAPATFVIRSFWPVLPCLAINEIPRQKEGFGGGQASAD